MVASKVVVSGYSRRANLMGRPVMGRIKDFRARLRLPERFWVREAAKVALCPSRAPKRRRGGVVAPKVAVSGYSRRGNLMGRPVMRRIKDFRARLRLSERFWVRRAAKVALCPSRAPKRRRGGVW